MEYKKLYSFVISPPDEIKAETYKFKINSFNIIGKFKSLHSIAHVTVAKQDLNRFKVIRNMNERLRNQFKNIPAVELSINGFNYFGNNKIKYTVYANIEVDRYAVKWFEVVRTKLGYKGQFVPHITIARNLTTKQFEKLWPHFQNRNYKKTFIVNYFTILERELSGDLPTKIFSEIPFGTMYLPLQSDLTLFD